jgi:hypothetical protein
MWDTWATKYPFQDFRPHVWIGAHISHLHWVSRSAVYETIVEVCRSLKNVLADLLGNLEANARDLADFMVIDEGRDVVPVVIVSSIRRYQCRLTVRLVDVSYKLAKQLVRRYANRGCVSQFVFEFLPDVLSQMTR